MLGAFKISSHASQQNATEVTSQNNHLKSEGVDISALVSFLPPVLGRANLPFGLLVKGSFSLVIGPTGGRVVVLAINSGLSSLGFL